MEKFDRKPVGEVYAEYVANGGKLNRVLFTKQFLRENPEYRVMVGKVKQADGSRKSVRILTVVPKYFDDNVSAKIWG